jgi:Protein of unknown function (DUF559)
MSRSWLFEGPLGRSIESRQHDDSLDLGLAEIDFDSYIHETSVDAPLVTNSPECVLAFRQSLRLALVRSLETARFNLTLALRACESPIEAMLLFGLVASGAHGHEVLLRSREGDWSLREPEPGQGVVSLTPQIQMGEYRCDFLAEFEEDAPDFEHPVTTRDGIEIPGTKREFSRALIECDGHDFHEKTKVQATRDKRRDRFLQSLGFPVLRFSGSEIWRDPIACGIEVCAFLEKASR